MTTYALPITSSPSTKVLAQVIGNDPDSITCVCGNAAHDDGFMITNEHGTPAYLATILPVPAGTTIYNESNAHMVCYACGAFYSDEEIETTSEARVLTQFDVTTVEFTEAINRYWEANSI